MNPADATAYLTLDPEAHRRPDELFRALRRAGTIHHDAATDFYVVTDPDTMREIFLDPQTYSSVDAFSPALTQATHYFTSTLSEEQRRYFVSPVESIMTSEGDTHQRLRKAINPYFTRTAVRRRHAVLRAKAAAVLDGLPEDADWVTDFCMPFTVHVIADLLGVPDADYDTITRWDRILTGLATGAELGPDAITTYLDFTKEFTEYFAERAARLAAAPDGSLLSHLVQQGDTLTEHERIQFLLILFPAGSTTTVILMTHLAIRMAQDPGLIPRLRTDPGGTTEFVEDCIIERAPAANVFRTTTREVTLRGTHLPAGAHLVLVVAAAHQDLADRAGHFAFGHGVHRCLGNQLARAEAVAAIEEILLRYDRITLTQPLDTLPFHPHLLIPGYPHLPVRLGKAKRDQR